MDRPVYEIDGEQFSTLEGFESLIWPIIAGHESSGRTNLDAFHDILSWPSVPYLLVWKNSELSRKRLGHAEIAKKLKQMLQTCHPSNRPSVSERLEKAQSGEGPTMFDWLVEIIRENEPHVELQLT
jgi:RNAse (barnase) inhibitor barstar